MPTVQIEKPRSVCPAGIHEFVLADVEEKWMTPFGGNEDSEKQLRWLWRFVSNKRDEEGQYCEVAIITGTEYGNSQARLTWLLDLLIPGISRRDADQFNTDSLLGAHFEGSVKHEQSKKDPEKKLAVFAYLRPVEAVAADEADPFAQDDGAVICCDVCNEELTDALIKNSEKRWGPDVHLCHKHGRERMAAEKEPAAV